MTGSVLKIAISNGAKVQVDNSKEIVIVIDDPDNSDLFFCDEDDEFVKAYLVDEYLDGRFSLPIFVGDRIEFKIIDHCLTLTKVILSQTDKRNIPPKSYLYLF